MFDPDIRRQVYELTLADLERCPIWEFALDEEGREGQDEATVRPVKAKKRLSPGDGMFVVRAAFQLADKTTMVGYLTPSPMGSGIADVQPAVVTEGGHVAFWYGMTAPSRKDITASYRKLGKTRPSQVFPLRYEPAVAIQGKFSGKLDGFYSLGIQSHT